MNDELLQIISNQESMQDNHLIIKQQNSDNVITEDINIYFKMLHSNNSLEDWTKKQSST